jgi:D-xylonolactonase
MTVDSEGHIWTTRWGGWAVRHLDPSGRFVEKIDMPVERVSSCAFGGPNLDELYITTAGGQPDRDTPEGTIYRVAMPVKGQREFRSRIRL